MTTQQERLTKAEIDEFRELVVEKAQHVVKEEGHAWMMTFFMTPEGHVLIAPFCGNPNDPSNRSGYASVLRDFCYNKYPVAIIQVAEGWQVPCKDESEETQLHMEWDDIRKHPDVEERLNITSFERNKRGRKYERVTSFRITRNKDEDKETIELEDRQDIDDAKIQDPLFNNFLPDQPDPEQYLVLSTNAVYDPELDSYFLGAKHEFMQMPPDISPRQIKMLASHMMDEESLQKLPEGMIDWIKDRLESDTNTFAEDVIAIAEHMELNGRSAMDDDDSPWGDDGSWGDDEPW